MQAEPREDAGLNATYLWDSSIHRWQATSPISTCVPHSYFPYSPPGQERGSQHPCAERRRSPSCRPRGDRCCTAAHLSGPSVARRNERERKRVRLVNQGFAALRQHVPRDRCTRRRRTSKVETLRAAIQYIRQLQQLLMESQLQHQQQETNCNDYGSPAESVLFNPTADPPYAREGCGMEAMDFYTSGCLQASLYEPSCCDVNSDYSGEHHGVPWFT